MLNIYSYLPISGVFVLLLIFEFSLVIYNFFTLDVFLIQVSYIDLFNLLPNINVLGQTLYTFFALNFILAGYILLIAMIGAIYLTLHHRLDVKRQTIFNQIDRNTLLRHAK